MSVFRHILFWLFALVYVALCPLLIIRTLGYLNTGLIVIYALPADAHVQLNGRPFRQDMPATLPRLQPGPYTVRVERDGYRPWTRDVLVEKKRATVLDNVFLLPQVDAMEVVAENPFDSLRAIDGTPYIILLAQDQASDARVFNHQKRTLSPLFPTNAPYASRSVRRLFTRPNSPYVLAQLSDDPKNLYLWVRLDTEPNTVQDITALMHQRPAEVLWSKDAPEQLFCFEKGVVTKVDLAIGTNELEFATDWLGLGVFDHTVCGLDAEARFVRKTLDGAIVGTEDTALNLDQGLFSKIRFVGVHPMANGALLFHESGGRLLQTELPHLLAEDHIEGVRGFDQGERALVWQRRAFGLLETAKPEREGQTFAVSKSIRWIYQGRLNVASPYFMHGGNYALCALDGMVTIFDLRQETAPPDEPREAFRVRRDTGLAYVDKEGMLYALDPDSSRLVAIQILPIEVHRERLFRGGKKEEGAAE